MTRAVVHNVVAETLGFLTIGLIAVVVAAPARSAVFTATFTGTTIGAVDDSGVFGLPNTDLSGKAVTVQLRVDTGIPGILDYYGLNAEYFYSGDYYGYNGLPTAITSTLTIDHHTIAITGNYKGSIIQENGLTPLGRSGNGDQLLVVVDEYNHANKEYSFGFSISDNFTNDFLPTEHIATPGHYMFGPSLAQNNSFSLSDNTINNGAPIAYGSFHFTDLVVAAGGVPEPAPWALLVAGFGLIGMALRSNSTLANGI